MPGLGLILALVTPLGTAGLIKSSPAIQRGLYRARVAPHVAAWAALLALLFTTRTRGWAVGALLGASAALVLVVGWTAVARRRGWGSPSTLPRRWDWALFDAQFRAYAERASRRGRRERDGGA